MSYEYIETTKEEMVKAVEDLSAMAENIMTLAWRRNISEQIGKLMALANKLHDTKPDTKKETTSYDEICNDLYFYWESLSEPKKTYTSWFYGAGGVRETLEHYHKKEKELSR